VAALQKCRRGEQQGHKLQQRPFRLHILMPEGADLDEATDDAASRQQAGAVFALLQDLGSMQRELSTKIDRQYGLLESLVNWQKNCPPAPVVATPIIARQPLPGMDHSPFPGHVSSGSVGSCASGTEMSQGCNSGVEAAVEEIMVRRRSSSQSSRLFEDDEDLQGRRPRSTRTSNGMPVSSGWLSTFFQGQLWSYLCTIMLIINTAFMGLEIQIKTNRSLGYSETLASVNQTFFDVMEIVFLTWMIFEVLVNVFKQRWDFIYGEDSGWNAFDMVLIVLSVGLQVFNYGSLSFLRVARLFHLGRLLRALRLCKFLQSIRSVVISLSYSFRHLISAAIVMGFLMYTTALIMMQEMSRRLPEGQDLVTGSSGALSNFFVVPKDSDTTMDQVAKLYGRIDRTMLTLFMTISGGMEWAVAAEPLAEFGAIFGVVWTAYISFMVFCVLNVLVGIFVDVALQAMVNDREHMIQAQVEDLNTFIRMIQAVFKTSDTDGSGTLSREEFDHLMTNEELITYLRAMGIDVDEASGLFRYLDEDNSGTVTVDEFVTGFLRLKGPAKAVDMVTLIYESRKISRKLNKLFRETKFLHGVVGGLHYVVSNPHPGEFAPVGVSIAEVPWTSGAMAQRDLWAPDKLPSEGSSLDEDVQDDAWLKPWRPQPPSLTAKLAVPKPSGSSSRSRSSSSCNRSSFSVPAEFF